MSTEVWFVRVNDALVSTDEESLKAIRRIEPGECKAFKPIGVRDPVSFRLYWGAFMDKLAKYVPEVEIDRQDGEPIMYPINGDKKRADRATKMATGHYEEEFVGNTGYSIRSPLSISYEKMTPAEWDEFLPKVMEFLLEKVSPYIEVPEARDDMLKAIERRQREYEKRERAA
jgi:hypothetical protein